jgi:hypothetical protein
MVSSIGGVLNYPAGFRPSHPVVVRHITFAVHFHLHPLGLSVNFEPVKGYYFTLRLFFQYDSFFWIMTQPARVHPKRLNVVFWANTRFAPTSPELIANSHLYQALSRGSVRVLRGRPLHRQYENYRHRLKRIDFYLVLVYNMGLKF